VIPLRNEAAIVGIGNVPFGRRGELADKGHLRLAAEAITLACEDAGIAGKDVDGYSSYYTEVEPAELASAFGAHRLRYTAQTWGGGGASMCGAFQNAALAVSTGHANYVVVHKVATMAGTARYGQAFGQMGQAANAIGGPFAFSVPYGLQSPGQMFALAVRRHMHLYGTTSEQFAHVAINARSMAANNPAARFREPITVADHQASPMIADPLRRLDFCMESDYGCAVVIASSDRARDLRQKPAYVAAAAVGAPYRYGNALMSFYNQPDEDFASSGHRTVAEELYRHSSMSLRDMDAAMLYDHFTAMMIMALEAFGFCKKGEGGPYVADGNLGLDRTIPVNTHGGNLAEAYTHGMTHVMEAVRQIRGTAINQIDSATNILVVGGAGPSPTSGMILTGER
jgi:acetyl-CoA acetyltransferase